MAMLNVVSQPKHLDKRILLEERSIDTLPLNKTR